MGGWWGGVLASVLFSGWLGCFPHTSDPPVPQFNHNHSFSLTSTRFKALLPVLNRCSMFVLNPGFAAKTLSG